MKTMNSTTDLGLFGPSSDRRTAQNIIQINVRLQDCIQLSECCSGVQGIVLIYLIVAVIVFALQFIVCSVSSIVCVVLCAVFV
jgi:hypothetical protein